MGSEGTESAVDLNLGSDEGYTKAKCTYLNILSLLTSMALIRTMSCKRFVRALADGSKPPDVLAKSLGQAMKLATDKSLTIPAGLQARATRHMA